MQQRRFRIFDLHTPWLWVVSFYHPHQSPAVTIDLYDERQRFRRGECRWWFHALTWEDEPVRGPFMAVFQKEKTND